MSFCVCVSVPRQSRSTPNRNVTIYPYASSLGVVNPSRSENVQMANTFLFAQGLSGGQMILGGSNIGSLGPSTVSSTVPSVPEPSNSKVSCDRKI